MAVEFDRIYWPECGTIIAAALPADLDDLWEYHADQASVFVAEAIIENPPRVFFQGDGRIEIFLWTVGGDTLVLYEPLDQLIADMDFYDGIRSQEQADDVIAQIATLEKIEAAIATAKNRMHEQLAAWKG
jgi:hypothetical protein